MAICIHQKSTGFGIVGRYYAARGAEPTLTGKVDVSGTDSFKPDFLSLVTMLDDKKQSSIVLVTHGTSGGFTMPITSESSVSADTSVLDDILTIVAPTPTTDIEYRRTIAKGNAKIDDKQLNAIVGRCQSIRSNLANAWELHIRGCNIGKDSNNLDKIKKLFGCKVVTAPTCAMIYATFNPFPAPNVNDWAQSHNPAGRRRTDLKAGSSALIVDMDDLGTTATSQGAIQKRADLPQFANTVYANTTHGIQPGMGMVLAAMWEGSTFHLPHESGYTGQLVSA